MPLTSGGNRALDARRHTIRGILLHRCFLIAALIGTFAAAHGANPTVAVQVSNETAPPGAAAQIKVSLASPVAIVTGRIIIDLDPAIFGDITAAAVFSAAGDAYGLATISGQHLDAQFTSPSGFSILTITVPVLPGVAQGTKTTITPDAGDSFWNDLQGTQYSLAAKPGTFSVGGALSVSNVVPGSGILSAGSMIEVDGTGFAPATTIEVDGASIASVHYAGPQQMYFVLAAPTEMTGKRVRLKNPDGAQVAYISSLRGVPVTPDMGRQPMFSLLAGSVAITFVGSIGPVIAIENQNPSPVDITFRRFFTGISVGDQKVTIPSGGLYMNDAHQLGAQAFESIAMIASSPVRMLRIDWTRSFSEPFYAAAPVTFTSISALPQVPASQVSVNANALTWVYQSGSAAPPPQTIVVYRNGSASGPIDFTVSASTASGGAWLAVTPSRGNTTTAAQLAVSVSPSSLAAGSYSGTITVTPIDVNIPPSVVQVSLTVSLLPFVTAEPSSTFFTMDNGGPVPSAQTIAVNSNGTPAAFTATATTKDAVNWLSVNPSSGITPSTLTVAVNPTGLSLGSHQGSITITGPANKQVIDYALYIKGPPSLSPYPSSLTLVAKEGASAKITQYLFAGPLGPSGVAFTASATTASGGDWLSVTVSLATAGAYKYLGTVTANPSGLLPGTYTGTITLDSDGFAEAQVPVTLIILSASPPPPSVSPSSVVFNGESGRDGTLVQMLNVESGGTPLQFALGKIVTTEGGNWLLVQIHGDTLTPGAIQVSVQTINLVPGVYHGSFVITAISGSITVDVTLTVVLGKSMPPIYPNPPIIGSIVNGASQAAGTIAPGEIVTIHGMGIGSPGGFGPLIDSAGRIATSLNGVRVLFDGVPAPLLYVSGSQLNVIVPPEIPDRGATMIEVEFWGVRSAAWGVPLAPAAPAIFTLDGSGGGHAAVLNQDNSVNDPSNPAARGSTIQIFGTGRGLEPTLQLKVTIGGIDAQTTYVASVNDAAAGLFQVNAVVPQGVAPGPNIPIVLSIGSARSPDGTTIAVQ